MWYFQVWSTFFVDFRTMLNCIIKVSMKSPFDNSLSNTLTTTKQKRQTSNIHNFSCPTKINQNASTQQIQQHVRWTHQISLVPLWHLLDEFQVGGAHHGLLDGQVGQQVVVLHDVARVLAERAQVTLLTTH